MPPSARPHGGRKVFKFTSWHWVPSWHQGWAPRRSLDRAGAEPLAMLSTFHHPLGTQIGPAPTVVLTRSRTHREQKDPSFPLQVHPRCGKISFSPAPKTKRANRAVACDTLSYIWQQWAAKLEKQLAELLCKSSYLLVNGSEGVTLLALHFTAYTSAEHCTHCWCQIPK